jgi:hypothetical protein
MPRSKFYLILELKELLVLPRLAVQPFVVNERERNGAIF